MCYFNGYLEFTIYMFNLSQSVSIIPLHIWCHYLKIVYFHFSSPKLGSILRLSFILLLHMCSLLSNVWKLLFHVFCPLFLVVQHRRVDLGPVIHHPQKQKYSKFSRHILLSVFYHISLTSFFKNIFIWLSQYTVL